MRKITLAAIAVSVLVSIGIIAFKNRQAPSVARQGHVDQSVLKAWQGFIPFALSTSPDGKRLLRRFRVFDKREDDATAPDGLSVVDLTTGRTTNQYLSNEPLLRAVWRKDSGAIAYFSQDTDTGARKLYVWDLNADVHRMIHTPTSYSQPMVRWAEDGAQIAYIANPGGLLVVDVASDRLWSFDGSIKCFDWSPGSARLAVVTAQEPAPDKLWILNRGGEIEDSFELPGRNIQEVCWQRGQSVLLLAHAQEAQSVGRIRYELTKVDPTTFQVEDVFQSDVNVREISWLPDGALLFHSQGEADEHRIFILRKGTATPIPITAHGAYHLRGISFDGNSIDCMQYDQAANQIVRLQLDGSSAPLVLAGPKGANHSGIRHETVKIDSKDGMHIPLLISYADPATAQNAALIRIHASGTVSLAAERWAETQLYLLYGVHVVHVACRPGAMVDDLLATCRYVARELGIPKERVVIFGGSTGAKVAVDAALHDPDCAGIVALTGYTRGRAEGKTNPIVARSDLKLIAFHGELDRQVPPESAKRDLEFLFGSKALETPTGMWEVIPGEAHWILSDLGLARVHTAILDELGLISSGRFLP